MSEQKVSIPFVSQKVEDLLMWRDQMKTGIVFGSISVFCIYVLMWRTPLLSLLCYSLTTVAVGSFLWANFGQVLGIGAPALPDKLKDGLSENDWKTYVSTAKPHVDAAIAVVYRVLSGKEIHITVAVMMISYIAGKIFAVFNVLLVSYIAVLCAFSLPKLYEMNKEKIDHEVVPKIQETWKALYAKLDEAVLQKIPRAGVTAVKKED